MIEQGPTAAISGQEELSGRTLHSGVPSVGNNHPDSGSEAPVFSLQGLAPWSTPLLGVGLSGMGSLLRVASSSEGAWEAPSCREALASDTAARSRRRGDSEQYASGLVRDSGCPHPRPRRAGGDSRRLAAGIQACAANAARRQQCPRAATSVLSVLVLRCPLEHSLQHSTVPGLCFTCA